jgi:uncharacterized alpha/beta hydrolase family protein
MGIWGEVILGQLNRGEYFIKKTFIRIFIIMSGLAIAINSCGTDKKSKSNKPTQPNKKEEKTALPPVDWDGLSDWPSSSFLIVDEVLK